MFFGNILSFLSVITLTESLNASLLPVHERSLDFVVNWEFDGEPCKSSEKFQSRCRTNQDQRIIRYETRRDPTCHADTEPCLMVVDFDIIYRPAMQQNYTLSTLIQYECLSKQMIRIFSWADCSVNIKCKDISPQMEISCRSGAWLYNLTKTNATLHLMLQRQHDGTIEVFANEDVLNSLRGHEVGRSSEVNSSRLDSFIVYWRNNPEGQMCVGSGNVLAADIFFHLLNDEERRTETEYMLHVPSDFNNTDCSCRDGNLVILDGKWTCTRGNSNISYCFITQNATYINITLDRQAMITKLKMTSCQRIQGLYFQGDAGNAAQMYNIPTMVNEESTFKQYSWNYASDSRAVITQKIQIQFNYGRSIADESCAHNIERKPIQIYGRYLDDVIDSDGCSCFPRNGDRCDSGGQCICRRQMMVENTGKQCSPYLKNIASSFDAETGDTILTVYGGLLKPKKITGNPGPYVLVGGRENCNITDYSDDSITCSGKYQISPKEPYQIRVQIIVGLLRYTIKSQLEFWGSLNISKVTYWKRSLNMRLQGSDLHLIQQCDMTITISTVKGPLVNGTCKVHTPATAICSLPEINYDKTGTAKVRIYVNGKEMFTSSFTLHMKPTFHTAVCEDSNGIIDLKGDHLNECCEKKDYKIYFGDNTCKIIRITKTSLSCQSSTRHINEDGASELRIQALDQDVGELSCRLEGSNTTTLVFLSLVGMVLVGALSGVIASTIKYNLCSKLRWRISQILSRDPSPMLSSLQTGMKSTIKEITIDGKDLEIHERIGRGNTGYVYRGSLKVRGSTRSVALKALKECKLTDEEELKAFLEEATIMKDFDHPNVLSLIGVVIEEWDIYVVLPYLSNGDLRTYLSRIDFDLLKFIGFVLDVARGMEYLSSLRFIHRDLAARNCMVDSADRVYIGDFGLTRDLHENDFYQTDDRQQALPYKWMAPESLQDRTFTTKSDVWAFGVLMWEVFALGMTPYCHVETSYLYRYLLNGNRLEKTDYCPDLLFAWMNECWAFDPPKRPTFESLVIRLKKSTTLHPEFSLLHNTLNRGPNDVSLLAVPSTSTAILPPILKEARKKTDVVALDKTSGGNGTVGHGAESSSSSAAQSVAFQSAHRVCFAPTLPTPSRSAGSLRLHDRKIMADAHPGLLLAAMVQNRGSMSTRKWRRTWSMHCSEMQAMQRQLQMRPEDNQGRGESLPLRHHNPRQEPQDRESTGQQRDNNRSSLSDLNIMHTPSKWNDYVL